MSETYIGKDGKNVYIHDSALHRALRNLVSHSKSELVQALENPETIAMSTWLYNMLLISKAEKKLQAASRVSKQETVQEKVSALKVETENFVTIAKTPDAQKLPIQDVSILDMNDVFRDIDNELISVGPLIKKAPLRHTSGFIKKWQWRIQERVSHFNRGTKNWTIEEWSTKTDRHNDVNTVLKTFSSRGGEVEELLPNSAKYGIAMDLFEFHISDEMASKAGFHLLNSSELNHYEHPSMERILRILGIDFVIFNNATFGDLIPTKMHDVWVKIRPSKASGIKLSILLGAHALSTLIDQESNWATLTEDKITRNYASEAAKIAEKEAAEAAKKETVSI